MLYPLVFSLALLLGACASVPEPGPAETSIAIPVAKAQTGVLASDGKLAIYRPQSDETAATIAEKLLGDPSRAWEIDELNGSPAMLGNDPIVIPLLPVNPGGIRATHAQTVPILCYHRMGPGAGKMFVSESNFARQMEWLATNQYRVVALKDLTAFIEGRQALPARSVVLTFDDGYESVYRYAFPLLKKYRFAATVFVYSDFIGASDALTWPQMQEMLASGLVDIQSHSKTHANLTEREVDEPNLRYQQRVDKEARTPRELIMRRLPQHQVVSFAFPYGDANDVVLEAMAQNQYRIAVTVNPGGNPFYAQPLMLRRTMIFGNHDLEAFKSRLQITRAFKSP
jgi:peptidoglycan/xylan/chitin deacetylase (PgdA/CDA1 family)